MSKRRYVFEGIVTPIRDYEENYLYIHKILKMDIDVKDTIKEVNNYRYLGITSFFNKSEIVDREPCEPAEDGDLECDIEDCPLFRDGKCKPPKFKVRIVFEIEEVDSDVTRQGSLVKM